VVIVVFFGHVAFDNRCNQTRGNHTGGRATTAHLTVEPEL
jgi:hypothetical protein